MTLFMLIGLPGSGKSTVAAELIANECESWLEDYGRPARILSSDAIREELFGDAALQYSDEILNRFHGDEARARQYANRKVFGKLYDELQFDLQWGIDVIFDATNLTKQARSQAISIAQYEYNRPVVACVVRTPLDECLRRNSLRERVVPEEVICSMSERFEEPTIEEGFAEIRSY